MFFKSNQTKSDEDNPFHNVVNNIQTQFNNLFRIPNPNPSKEIKKLLKEIPVYRMTYTNPYHHGLYAPLSPWITEMDVNFYFFTEQDAQSWMNLVRPENRTEFQTIKVSLSEVIKAEKVDRSEMVTRIVPELSEVANAIKERNKAGFHDDSFSGVPIFQSDALKTSDDGSPNSPSPAFFRRTDLEEALRDKKGSNIESELIQVTALEDIIQEMKDCSTSKWNNVALIPPGNEKLFGNPLLSFLLQF
ncbi:hypothetical protein ABFS82_14G296300 [Erythranthe guttata]